MKVAVASDPVLSRHVLPEGARAILARRLAEIAAGRFLIRIDEAAVIIGLARSTAYDAVRRGHLPTVSFGRRLLVPVARLESLLLGSGFSPIATSEEPRLDA